MKFGNRLIHELKGLNKKYNCPTPNKNKIKFTRLIYNNGKKWYSWTKVYSKLQTVFKISLGAWDTSP